MVNTNRVKPSASPSIGLDRQARDVNLVLDYDTRASSSSSRTELDSFSTTSSDELSYSKLKKFNALDPSLGRLLVFMNCFGLTVNFVRPAGRSSRRGSSKLAQLLSNCFKITILIGTFVISSEVVYDANLRQSKLLAEQKRAAPLMTFIILAYSWSSIVIPAISNFFLLLTGSNLFRFHSRTMATVCDGSFYGEKSFVDGWYYYAALVLIAFTDACAQLVLLGVWPPFISDAIKSSGDLTGLTTSGLQPSRLQEMNTLMNGNITSESPLDKNISGANASAHIETAIPHDNIVSKLAKTPQIRAHLLDMILGDEYAHGNLGVCLKCLMLMIQFVHTHAFCMVVSSLANHYASIIESINQNLNNYDSRTLLKQLIVLRNSTEQISLIISIPFSLVMLLVFMRQISLIGVLIQATMSTHEIWATCLETMTGGLTMFMVFNFCNGLQSASRQTHRLKTYESVIDDESGGDQSIYEFLDYLNRLSKSIRFTFFNIASIDNHSLVSLYGQIMGLTFVTS